ncbi:MAG: glycosyltransferase [Prevotellaceae bacterium]|nr:glycosyltransferase [Candidatus Minthosoma equi]
MRYSIVIPVYNRPDEADELLDSLTKQTVKDFEVVVVEDGSTIPCKDVVEKYTDVLNINYLTKKNGGPGPARNYGVENSKGEYVLILDSDCIIPEGYIAAIEQELSTNPCDAFGGPDAAHESFTNVQKAISYSMTSFFTTGGIRGGKKKGALDKFYPRSFNMGMRRSVYLKLHGFSKMRFGEDIDFSYRIVEGGYSCRLFPEAWVYHKRRTDFSKFFKQVFNSGIARINLEKRHPGTMKLVHMLPMVFTLGVILLFLGAVALRQYDYWTNTVTGVALPNGHFIAAYSLCLWPIVLYSLLILIDSTIKNRNLFIGFLSVEAAFVQLMGYGFGFLKAWWLRCVQGKDEFTAFEKNFYD